MTIVKPFSILFLCITLLFLFSCNKKEDSSKSSELYDLETAKIISHLPPEVIEPDASVKIRFVDAVIDKKEVGGSAPDDVLEFDPAIKGTFSWQDERTLVLTPAANLKKHESYKGLLNLEKIDSQKFADNKPVSFEIRVAGQEMVSFKGDFELVEKGNPKKVRYAGIINFMLNVDPKLIEQALSLKKNNSRIQLTIARGADSKQILFKSTQLIRNGGEQNFVMKLDAEKMMLPSAFSKDIKLPAIKDLQVTNITKDEGSGKARVRIEFSDELDNEQKIDGFISVKPALKFTFRKMGKTVFINAPFEYGKTYSFEIQKGISSRWATKTTGIFKEKILFEDLLPEIKFAQSGIILPSSNLQKVAFMSVNVRKVQVQVSQVFESNIGQFMQMGQLSGAKDRSDQFRNINRVGVTLTPQTLEIGGTKNRWLQHQIDLSKLIKPDMKGLLLLSLRFERNDMIYDDSADEEYSAYRNRRRNRYGDPGSYWYLQNKGRVYKPIILSDIGLTYKKLDGRALVFATNLLSSDPLDNVKIRLRTYQNQVIAERVSNSRGIAEFEQPASYIFYFEA
jgi:hypothetical protein